MATSRSRAGTLVTSRPFSSIRPEVTASSPAIMRSVVVLPQPEGPSSVKNSPSWISRLTPRIAGGLAPYALVTSVSTMVMPCVAPLFHCPQRDATHDVALEEKNDGKDRHELDGC